MKLRVTLLGRSYDTAADLPEEIDVAIDSQLDDALQSVNKLLTGQQELPGSCLVVHNGKHLGTIATHDNIRLADQDDLLLIAPVAGG